MDRTQITYSLVLPPSFFSQRYGKLACTCFTSSDLPVVSSENMPGRVDTLVDAGIKVSNVEFLSDILDISYRENNCAAPPVVPSYPPSDENGPSELDFEIYASNSMANYEPPPPPPIPFSAPFEDYYGDAIGVDYICREEKPANSLLRFLDSLNAKKGDDGGENTKKHLFTSSSSHMTDSAEGKPLPLESIGQHMAEDIDVGSNTQEVINGSGRSSVSSPVEAVVVENVMKEVSEYPPSATDGRSSSVRIMQHAEPSIVVASNEFQPTGRSTSFQAMSQERLTDGRSLEDLNKILPTFASVNNTQVKDSSEFVMSAESRRSASVPPGTRPPDYIGDVHHKPTQKIKGSLRQAGDSHAINENKENVDIPELQVSEVHELASVDMGGESLPFIQTLDSSKERLSISHFYVPQKGDLVLGAVTFVNDQKVDLEIGAELSALMPLRDLQPILQHDSNMFFDIFGENDFSVPFGESLLLKDECAVNSCSRTAMVDTGTVVVAEVMGKTIIDGRAILSCKSAAQKLAWHRIEQLMRLGEAVKIKIMQWNEGGLLGAFEGVRAFIPKTELLQRLERTALLRNYVGRTLSVAVVQNERETSNLIASEVKAWMCKNLQLGTVHDVTVTKVHSYGMQVEIDNTKIRGFVHKTNFSKEYVSSVTNYFVEGDKAKVMLIKGRDPTKVSFSLADLEKENGLLLRDKEQVFRDAEDMGKRYRERFLEQERRLYAMASSEISLDHRGAEIANTAWLHS